MVSGDYDIGTPGGRLNTFRPIDPVTGEPIRTYEWAEKIGMGKDVLGYVLRNSKKPGLDVINIIDSWLLSVGHSAEDCLWWRLGKDIPKKEERVVAGKSRAPLARRRAAGIKKSEEYRFGKGLEPERKDRAA